jgi:hypothetical protein
VQKEGITPGSSNVREHFAPPPIEVRPESGRSMVGAHESAMIGNPSGDHIVKEWSYLRRYA